MPYLNRTKVETEQIETIIQKAYKISLELSCNLFSREPIGTGSTLYICGTQRSPDNSTKTTDGKKKRDKPAIKAASM